MNLVLLGFWRRVLRQYGVHGIAALALAVSTLLIAVWIPQLIRQGDELRAAIEVKAHVKPPSAAIVAVSRIPAGQQIGAFVSAFPPLSQNSEDLREVFLSAKRHSMQLPRGDYQFKQDTTAPLVILTATFPLSADYAAIKDFTADVLRNAPNVSMDELRMTRNAAGSNVLESVVRFSFVYQRP
jgi:hypothetical protein